MKYKYFLLLKKDLIFDVYFKFSLAPVNDSRNALMDSIRKGTTLKKVDPATSSTGSGSSDTRSKLLSEIQQGKLH